MRKLIVVLAVVLGFLLAGCSYSQPQPNGQQEEQKSGQKNYDRLVAQDPAHDLNYSYTRKTINFWTDTWGKPGKNAYLYLMNNEGKVIAYAVLDGPPVSMCTSLRPNYQFVDPKGDGVNDLFQVPAPGTDGAFYSGGECNTYYGKDAATGAYVQYTAGQGINPLLRDQPFTPDSVQGARNLATGKVK
jgi:hypothetical protein